MIHEKASRKSGFINLAISHQQDLQWPQEMINTLQPLWLTRVAISGVINRYIHMSVE